jgi:hypothetical protein
VALVEDAEGFITVLDEGNLVSATVKEIDFIGPGVNSALISAERSGVTINATGTGTGSSFLPPPDEFDETDLTFFYHGWESVNGDWLIRRARRDGPLREDATQVNNVGFVSLALAWPNRQTLTYS